MSTNKTKKGKLRKKLFGSLFVISLAFIMVSVSFSWFTTGNTAKVSGITMEVEEGDDLSLLVGDGKSDVLYLEFPEEFPLQARTGNGLYFYDAIMGYRDEAVEPDENGNYAKEREVIGYKQVIVPGENVTCETYSAQGIFAADFSMHVGETSTVYLYREMNNESLSRAHTKLSGIIPATKDQYDSEGDMQSPLGVTDIGNICGAMRVAILQKDANGVYVPTFIWAPATDIHLRETEDKTYEILTPEHEDFQYEESYLYFGESSEGNDPIVAGTRNGLYVDESTGITYAWGELTTKVAIGELIGGESNDFRLVIWVDGNDRECHNAMLGGRVMVSLHFGL